MKNTNYIINGILAVAVVVLFVLQFSNKKSESSTPVAGFSGDSSRVVLPIAYINADTLLINYRYAIDLNDILMNKIENLRADANQRAQRLSAEVVEFQRKVEMNAFATRERAVSEQQRLEKKQVDLQELMARNQNELDMERMKINQQLSDTVVAALKLFNKDKKYQVIFSNAGQDNILLADPIYDVTREVLAFLNNRYVPIAK